jgi:hypothetical protein
VGEKIGQNHGIEATRKRLNLVDPGQRAFDRLLGEPGKIYNEPDIPSEGTLWKLITYHNELLGHILPSLQTQIKLLDDRLKLLEAEPLPGPEPPPLGPFFATTRGAFLRNPKGAAWNMQEIKSAGFSWVALNVQDYSPDAWRVEQIMTKCQQAGLVYLPWSRAGHPGSDTRASCRDRLKYLVMIADAWASEQGGDSYLIANLEKELDQLIIYPQDVAEICGDRPVLISTEAWLYAQTIPGLPMSIWEPINGDNYVMGLQIFPTLGGISLDPMSVDAWADACVERAKAYGYRYVTNTFQAFGSVTASLYDRSPKAWSVYTGDDITSKGANQWSQWST